jgi:hypothetical protein
MNLVHTENIKSIFLRNAIIIDISTLLRFSITFYGFLIIVLSEFIAETKEYMRFKKFELYKDGNLVKEKDITIYRIEDRYGIGPYQTRLYNHDLIEREEGDKTPTPYTDMGAIWNYLEYKNIRREFVFGFTSMEQLYAWFTEEELDVLEDYGFDINMYSSNIYHETDKQVIFKKIV